MTAFVVFVRTYAVWIYLLCVMGIVLGAKWLVDARRLARTTLFSLEQERANEQSYRAIIVIVVALVAIGAMAVVNLVIAPSAPTPESPVVPTLTAPLTPHVFPSVTPVPTPTATLLFKPTESTITGVPPIALTPTRTLPRPTLPVLPSVTPAYTMLAPVITAPLPNGGTWIGEGQANAALTFRWNCDQCNLGSNDWYEVAINFVDKTGGAPRTVAGRTQDKFLPLKRIYEGGGFELYQKAKEDTYTWTVQIKREPGNQALSPRSETWKFVWK